MLRSLRSLTLVAIVVASLLVGATSANAGAPRGDAPVGPIIPANISWE